MPRAVCGVQDPRVGLLSIGEEDAKGNTLDEGSPQADAR